MKRATRQAIAFLALLAACSKKDGSAPVAPEQPLPAPASEGAAGAASEPGAAGAAGAGAGGATGVETVVCNESSTTEQAIANSQACPPIASATLEECKAHGHLFLEADRLCTEDCGPAYERKGDVCEGENAGGKPRCRQPTEVRRCIIGTDYCYCATK